MTKEEALEAAMKMMISPTIWNYTWKNHPLVHKRLANTLYQCNQVLEQSYKEKDDE